MMPGVKSKYIFDDNASSYDIVTYRVLRKTRMNADLYSPRYSEPWAICYIYKILGWIAPMMLFLINDLQFN